MRNLDDVTDEELKAAYDQTPALSNYVPWEEVQQSKIFKPLLINQIIARKEEQAMQKTPALFLAIDNKNKSPEFVGALPGAAPAPQPAMQSEEQPKKVTRRHTITLLAHQVEKINQALVLSRNCLRYGGMSDIVRNEALASLAESQKIIKQFYEPRV